MYAKILKFLTNLLFKRIFRGFLTPRKTRLPGLTLRCQVCGRDFIAYNKRQRICCGKDCTKVDRARQYRARLVFRRSSENKIAVTLNPSDLESEE
ncbi:hypothetical protein LCGC14_0474270 [marine sediment metagenome]|uniref:Uncharacterized protein n=1 Tax=marine sediment metagenome TaxID=412755 RepID=A0A0F9SU30_9ZZZZ